MKKYYTNWQGSLVLGMITFFLVISDSFQKYPDAVTIKADLFFALIWGFFLIILTKYSYASITGTTLKFVYLLFYRRTIDINSITEINDQPTYKAAKKSFRSLYIFYKDKNDEPKYIELRITIFPEKTLGKLIKELKRINPRIELNKYSQKLMDSTS